VDLDPFPSRSSSLSRAPIKFFRSLLNSTSLPRRSIKRTKPRAGTPTNLNVCRLRKNYRGTVEVQWSARLGQLENTAQGVQKCQTSHPPNPGAPRRALSHARPQRAKRRGGTTALRVGRLPLLWILRNGKAPPALPTSENLFSALSF
jgi:hypothetical protein